MNVQATGSNGAELSLFEHLVAMLATTAMQQMGMMPGPDGQPSPPDLTGASATIDILDMLQAKTEGNRTEPEEHILKEALASLKMAFVQIQDAGQAPAPAAEPVVEPAVPTAGETDKATIETPDAEDDGEGPRYHKTYG